MRLTSSAFKHGEHMPTRCTCDGDDVSPPLEWSDAPAGAGSFAVLCDDPDAPMGTWSHWALFDIPADINTLVEGCSPDQHVGRARQATTSFRRCAYGGPCPPVGHGTHHYHFRLYALDVERLPVADCAEFKDVERAAQGHALASAELIGTYSR